MPQRSTVLCLATALLMGCTASTRTTPAHKPPVLATPAQPAPVPSRMSRQEFGQHFEARGIVPGQQLPPLDLFTLEGQRTTLNQAWHDRPALIVTASLTCPVSRNRHDQVAQIAERFGDRIHVAYLYVIEAHPVTDASPYSGEEWVGKANRTQNILHRQPATMDERLELAKGYQQLLNVNVPVFVDPMANEGWHYVGAGPNVGLLFRPGGELAVKHGWFDGPSMERSIEHLLTSLTE